MGLMDSIKNHIIVVVIVVAVVSGGVVFSVVAWLNAERRRIMMEQHDLQKTTLQKKIEDLKEQLAAPMPEGPPQMSWATVLKTLDPIVFEKGDQIQVGRLFQSTFELATQSDVAKCDLCGDANLDWISVYPSAFAVKACRAKILDAIRRGVNVRIIVPSLEAENKANLSAFAATSSDLTEIKLLQDVSEAVEVLRDMMREISEDRTSVEGSLEVRSCLRPLFGNMWLRDMRSNTALAQLSIHTPGPSAAGGPWAYVRIGPSATPFLERLAAEFNSTWAASKPIGGQDAGPTLKPEP